MAEDTAPPSSSRLMRGGALLALVVGALAALALGWAAYSWLEAEGARRAVPGEPRSIVELRAATRSEPLDGASAATLAEALAVEAFGPSPEPADVVAAFTPAAAQLLQQPDAAIREAVLNASDPARREEGLAALQKRAETTSGALSAALWRLDGAVSAPSDPEGAVAALEAAVEAHPQDIATWRLLASLLVETKRPARARGATRVAEGLELAAQGRLEDAEARWGEALADLKAPAARAFVLGQMGDAAAQRRAFGEAEARYRKALQISTASKAIAAISVDASRLARVQLAQGHAADACRTLESAAAAGAPVAAEEIAAACGRARALRGFTPEAARPEAARPPRPQER